MRQRAARVLASLTPAQVHWCLAGLFGALLGPPPADCNHRVPFSGVLYHHLDMWVNPQLLLAPPFDRQRSWFPLRGLPHPDASKRGHFCASGPALEDDCGWGWCDPRAWERNGSMKATALWDVHTVRAALPDLAAVWPEGRLCRGHADIFYTPVRLMGNFLRIAPFFETSNHEISVHTILEMAAALSGFGHDAFVDTNCSGSCCENAGLDLASYTCAHRLDLTSAVMRQRVTLTLLNMSTEHVV